MCSFGRRTTLSCLILTSEFVRVRVHNRDLAWSTIVLWTGYSWKPSRVSRALCRLFLLVYGNLLLALLDVIPFAMFAIYQAALVRQDLSIHRRSSMRSLSNNGKHQSTVEVPQPEWTQVRFARCVKSSLSTNVLKSLSLVLNDKRFIWVSEATWW